MKYLDKEKAAKWLNQLSTILDEIDDEIQEHLDPNPDGDTPGIKSGHKAEFLLLNRLYDELNGPWHTLEDQLEG